MVLESLLDYFENKDSYQKLFRTSLTNEREFRKTHEAPPRHLYSQRAKPTPINTLTHNYDVNPQEDKYFTSQMCVGNEDINTRILTPGSPMYRRGCVVVDQGVSLGYIKLKGERTFLSWRTTYEGSKTQTLFGGIYGIPIELESLLSDISVDRGEWGYIQMDNFPIMPLRPIAEEKNNCFLGKSTRKKLRKERKKADQFIQENPGKIISLGSIE